MVVDVILFEEVISVWIDVMLFEEVSFLRSIAPKSIKLCNDKMNRKWCSAIEYTGSAPLMPRRFSKAQGRILACLHIKSVLGLSSVKKCTRQRNTPWGHKVARAKSRDIFNCEQIQADGFDGGEVGRCLWFAHHTSGTNGNVIVANWVGAHFWPSPDARG